MLDHRTFEALEHCQAPVPSNKQITLAFNLPLTMPIYRCRYKAE